MKIKWTETTQDRYYEMLEVLPPEVMTGLGFLMGEPFTHGTCTVTGNTLPRCEPYAQVGERFFVGSENLTVPEFQRLTTADVTGAAA
jgi:hypothetical protein